MFNDPQVLIAFIVAIVGGGGLVGLATAISSHWLGKQHADVEMTTTITDGFNILLMNQREENDRLIARITELERTICALQYRLKYIDRYLEEHGITMPGEGNYE